MLAELYIFLDGQKLKTFVHQGEEVVVWNLFEFNYKSGSIRLNPLATFVCGNKRYNELEGENKLYIIQKEDCYYQSYLFPYNEKEKYDAYNYFNNGNLFLMFSYDPYLSKVYLKIQNNKLETNCGALYVNNHKNLKNEVKAGDKIQILAHKIIVLANGFLVNDIAKKVNNSAPILYNKRILTKYDVAYLSNYPKPPLPPTYLKLEAKKEYREIDILKTIGPHLSLAFAMLVVTGFNFYQNYKRNGDLLSSIAMLILPISMSFSTLFWPLFFNRRDKKKYLKAEKKRLRENYIKEITNNSLQKTYQQQLLEYSKSFYFTKEKLLGIIKTKTFTFRNKDNIYFSVGKKDNIYYCLGLSKSLSIGENKDNNYAFLNKLIFELCVNYNPLDIALAIYDPQKISKYYWLSFPHFEMKEELSYFSSENEFVAFNEKENKRLIINIIIEGSEKLITKNAIYYYRSKKNVDYYVDKDVITNTTTKETYKTDYLYIDRQYYCSYLSGIYPNQTKNFSLNDLYGVTSLEKLDLKKNYTNNFYGLKADFAFAENKILSFNLGEKGDGPHGLLAGTTGSGKSELLCSLILSLCIFNAPDKCNIVLIDYKGGSLLQELSVKGKTLPHIVGSLTNLDKDNQQRLAWALKKECEEREALFVSLSLKAGVSISNIEDYQRLSSKYSFPAKAHLVIIVDEFAQLKKETPTFLEILLEMSRLGRSLGMHLILATQKPAGVISEEILANSHFRIALKTLDKWESQGIIGSNHAANLKEPGQFYLFKDNTLINARAFYTRQKLGQEVLICQCNNRFKPLTYVNSSNLTIRQYLCNKIITYKHSYLPNAIFKQKEDFVSYDSLRKRYKLLANYFVIGEVDDYKQKSNYLFSFTLDNCFLGWGEKEVEELMLFNALKNKKRVIGIGNNLAKSSLYCDCLSYQDTKLNILASQLLALEKKQEIIIYIENLGLLLAFNNYWKNEFKQLLLCLKQLKIAFVCAINNISNLPYALVNCFDIRFNLQPLKSNESLIFYNSSVNCSLSCLYHKELKSLTPLKVPLYKLKGYYRSYFKPLPKIIKPIVKGDKILLGYSKKTFLAIYAPKDILFLAQQAKNFKYYHLYKDAKFACNENNDIPSFLPSSYVWVGEGNYNQAHFKVTTAPLRANEVLFINNNTVEVLWAVGTHTV